jgi:hypothetical protein
LPKTARASLWRSLLQSHLGLWGVSIVGALGVFSLGINTFRA